MGNKSEAGMRKSTLHQVLWGGLMLSLITLRNGWAADAPSVSTPTPATPAVSAPVVSKPAAAEATGAPEYVGADTCLSCHTGYSAFKDSHHARAMGQVKGIEFSKTCETCHGPGSLHAAAAGDKSNPGFATIHNPKKLSAAELGKTCLECHQDENRMHWLGGQHERKNVSCANCHSMHEAKSDKNQLVAPTVDKVCQQCHQNVVAQVHRNSHMPVAEGKMDCSSCHNPHGSATPTMIKEASANDNCYSCHADKRGPFLWEHPPVRENCLNCHSPHGSHNEKMLVARLPFLCQRCHIASGHVPVPYDQTSINSGNSRIMNGSCLNCHPTIHGSNSPSGKVFTR
jgi:DmsE family decaheme c-type cytochrome